MTTDTSQLPEDPDRFEREAARMQRELARRAVETPADYYSVSNPGILFGYQQMARWFIAALRKEGRFPLAQQRIFDVGCGWGGWLVDLETWGAKQDSLAGIDLDPGRAGFAARRLPAADIRAGNATSLPWPTGSFDIVLLGTVFSSILDHEVKRTVAQEVTRLLASDGMVLWYDFFVDNPRNPNVRGIRAPEIAKLFPELEVSLRRVTLAPPIARRLARVSWTGCMLLEALRVLNTHYLGVLRRR